MTEIDDAQLAAWLTPAGIELNDSRLRELAEVVRGLTDNMRGHELDAVRASHGRLSSSGRLWAAQIAADKAPSAVASDSDALLQRLAGCAVVASFSATDAGICCALAVQTASFAGLSPLIQELPQLAEDELTLAGRQIRSRPEHREADSEWPGALGAAKMPTVRKPKKDDAGAITENVNVNALAQDVGVQSAAIRTLAQIIDRELVALVDRQAALDEEVEILWWCLRAVDDKGHAFAELPGPLRAVRAAVELSERTQLLPAPPSAPDLLARLLGQESSAPITFGDLAGTIDMEAPKLEIGGDSLLVLRSAALDHARGSTAEDDQSWRNVASNALHVDLDQKTSLLAGAQELYRELLLARRLSTDE